MSLDRVNAPSESRPLTAEQQASLAKLHQAAQQMESLFVDMLFKEMRKSAPPSSLTGKTSTAEQTFGEMLDTKRAEELSKSGALGIGKVLEQQLRAAVIGEMPAAPAVRPRPESEQ
jgi:peptidoglycan hydrolase FlgJ